MPDHGYRSGVGAPGMRRLRPYVRGLLTVGLLLILAYALWPSSWGGCSTLTIVSGHSMEPTYATGDLVWSRCGDPEAGDVVVYEPPDTNGARVIHRIVDGNGTDGWIMQGDNNDFLDPWKPDNSAVLGIATVHIPRLGGILYSLGNPWVWAPLLVIAGAVFLWPRAQQSAPVEQQSVEKQQEGAHL